MAITILTGAGASKPLGYPTTNEFFLTNTQMQSSPYSEVYNQLAAQLGSTTLDVEDVLALLEPAEDFLKTSPGIFIGKQLANQWEQKISSFSKYVRDRCFELYGQRPDEVEVSDLYTPLLELCEWEKSRISLYTANYDPVSDSIVKIALKNEIPAYDGFNQIGEWEPNLYRKGRIGLDIYRLHGSMSWVKDGNSVRNTRDYSLRIGNTEHLIIYPGYKGNPEDNEQEAFNYPSNSFNNELNEINILISIGFSFRDKYINDCLINSFKINDNLNLLIITPEWPDGIDGELSNLKTNYGDRIKHISGKFGEEDTIMKLKKHIAEIRTVSS